MRTKAYRTFCSCKNRLIYQRSGHYRFQQGIFSLTKNKGFQYNHFDFIITNPPFGSNIRQTEQAYMHQYGYALKDVDWLNPKSKQTARDNQSTEILFIEQCHNFWLKIL
ncbi:Eco57I restriction-modification methylase domain-containing protein [Candidatus Spongiihabitans sp.]|uniref:Eco57I restriction-modification methylase domain-containing protein n=1 Tax=Candidatus Spongiihabitans sp. TaxID=3101308 RepID=UPI003C7C68EB